MAYFPTATLTYATLPSPKSVAAGDFYLTQDAGEVWSDGSQWNVVAGTFPVSTFAQLPVIPTLPAGVIAYTSDLGLVVSTGGGSWSITGNAPAVLTAPGIQAAINAVGAAGGGIVQLPAQPISLSASLTMVSGVTLQGIAPQLVYNTIPDSGLTTLIGSTGGTIMAPSGAFPAITWNTAALGVPASQTAFSQAALTNIRIKDMGFQGGTYGIFAGGTNNPSAWYSQFQNLYFTQQTVVGFSITNYQHCQFNGNYSFGCQWGQFHGIDVSSATLAPGNSTYYDLYCANTAGAGGLLQRNITFLTTATTGGAANNNEFKFDRIQSNRFGGSSISQAATMVNTQTNITVTDGTKFAVGLPVSFSATVNGFTTATIYFVVSVAGNVIQVSSTYGGAAIAATGATAVNVTHTGFPCFEMIALAGSSMTNGVLHNLDMEGLATCGAIFQNCNGFDVNLSQTPGTGNCVASVCGRSFLNSTLRSPQVCNTDMDGSGPARAYYFFGSRNANASVGNVGAGMWYDSVSGKATLSLGGAFNNVSGGDLTFDPATTNGILAPRNYGIGQITKNVSGATFTVANLNLQLTNTTAAAVITLPSVIAANAGSWIEIFNNTASAQTINTDGVQLFNNVAGRTSLTLNTGASVRLTASNVLTWYISGASSTMTAGVISAPT